MLVTKIQTHSVLPNVVKRVSSKTKNSMQKIAQVSFPKTPEAIKMPKSLIEVNSVDPDHASYCDDPNYVVIIVDILGC